MLSQRETTIASMDVLNKEPNQGTRNLFRVTSAGPDYARWNTTGKHFNAGHTQCMCNAPIDRVGAKDQQPGRRQIASMHPPKIESRPPTSPWPFFQSL